MDNATKNLIRVIESVIGTVEDVYNRRTISLSLETLLQTRTERLIVSGSFAEGVFNLGSDIDIMNDISVFTAYSLPDHIDSEVNDTIPLVMVPSPQNHGYCMLMCLATRSVVPEMRPLFEYHENNLYLSSKEIINCAIYHAISENATVHGPCVQIKKGNVDIEEAICIHCSSWPEVANEWLSRPRHYGWPDSSLIRKVKNFSLVVPIGLPNSDTNSIEWRISFSLVERALIHSFNRTQFIVYCIMKRISKEIIGKAVPDVLCSYFIKTVLFYSVETTLQSMWKIQNILECLFKSIRILCKFVDDLYCPHYFVEGVNLFQRKVNSDNQPRLKTVLRNLLSMNLQQILSCLGEFSIYVRTDSIQLRRPVDTEMLSDLRYRWDITFFSIFFKKQECMKEMYEIVTNIVNFLCAQKTQNSNVIVHMRMFLCRFLADKLYNMQFRMGNATRYPILRLMERLYQYGTRSDVTFGYLQLASFYLMRGNINFSLNVINSIFNRFSPLVHVEGTKKGAQFINDYKQMICGRGFSARYKFRLCFAMASVYYDDNGCMPQAIHWQFWDNMAIQEPSVIEISPLTHAYFLQAACYVAMGDLDKVDISIGMMRDTIKDEYLSDPSYRHNEYNMLGYLLLKRGRTREAVDCHAKSFYNKLKLQHKESVDYKYNVAALRIMSCLRHYLHPVRHM